MYTLGAWRGTSDWTRFCNRLPTEIETDIWDKWPDAGVCVAIGHQLKVIDIDTDDGALMGAVLSVLPYSDVIKRGAKGFSAFYRGSPAIVSQPFSVGKERVVDLLAHGRQALVPPTIHPITNLPYVWNGTDSLENTSIDHLPELPDEVAERLKAALAPFGYEPPRAYETGEGDTLWRELNDTALRNLDRWVPALNLPGTCRSGKGYRAIAAWRGVENANLSFHAEGIRDWGADEPHTPINIVMLASACDLYRAVDWLTKQIDFKPSLPAANDGFDVSAFSSRRRHPSFTGTG
ncbi:bifunctional DNA primase/polymerase [Bradyrhizobium sp. Pa8]|uniref:bifunctional DNA primase/polymerase n=1 Tax=Bradyrhizobium sp. Pa8 TaxID=3386552 RepID=UPI00403F9B21